MAIRDTGRILFENPVYRIWYSSLRYGGAILWIAGRYPFIEIATNRRVADSYGILEKWLLCHAIPFYLRETGDPRVIPDGRTFAYLENAYSSPRCEEK